MELLESQAARDRIWRIIVQPLKGRGEPPNGWTQEAMMADYVLALGHFDEGTLKAAAIKVRSEHKYPTWPLAGDFVEACKKIGGPSEPLRLSKPVDPRYRVSVDAHAYVSRRLHVHDGLLVRAMQGGWSQDLRRWLFDEACRQIRAGQEPLISNAALEDQIAQWSIDGAARNASQAALQSKTRARPLSDLQRNLGGDVGMDEPAPERRPVSETDGPDLDEEIPFAESESEYGARAE